MRKREGDRVARKPKAEPSERIRRAEFARRMKVTAGAITHAINAGRLTLGDDKRIGWPEGRDEFVNATRSDIRHHGKEGGGHEAYRVARTSKVELDAELARLSLDERRGALVPLEAVIGEVSRAFVGLRDRVLGVSHRVAAQVADTSDRHECQLAIDAEIREALQGFACDYLAADR